MDTIFGASNVAKASVGTTYVVVLIALCCDTTTVYRELYGTLSFLVPVLILPPRERNGPFIDRSFTLVQSLVPCHTI